MRFSFSFLFLFIGTLIFAQPSVDSLNRIISSEKDPLTKAKAMDVLANVLFWKDRDSAFATAEAAIKLCEQAIAKENSADKKRALSLQLSYAFNALGELHFYKGNVRQAQENFFKALAISEKINDKEGLYASYGNVAVLHASLDDFEDAVKYQKLSIDILKEMKLVSPLALAYNNIGMFSLKQGKEEEALNYFYQGLLLRQKENNIEGLGLSYNSIGSLLSKMGKPDSALVCLKKAAEYYSRTHNIEGEGTAYLHTGQTYLRKNDLAKAVEFAEKGYALCKQSNLPRQMGTASDLLYQIYKKKGDMGNALAMLEKWIGYNDTVNNRNLKNSAMKQEMKYDFGKKSEADSLRQVQQMREADFKHEQAITRQRTFTYAGIFGFALMLVIAGISYRAYRQKQTANKIISEQKLLVEHKQKEILDSITYAKRIQASLLTPEAYIDKALRRLSKE